MGSPRITWTDITPAVTTWVADTLGSPVVAWESQRGGWSPGAADRLVCADGSRAFLKAAHPGLNPDTPGLYRLEIAAARLLGPDVPCAHLIDAYDDGTWVALLLEDIEGRHPRQPWRLEELRAVLAALDALAASTTPVTAGGIPSAVPEHLDLFGGFERLRDDPPPVLDPWVAGRIDLLADRARRGALATEGDSLGHGDLRADNLLVQPGGRVRIVDWPSACRSAPWCDGVGLAVDIEQHGGLVGGEDHVAVLETWAAGHGATAEDVTDFLVGMLAYYTDAARRPAPPGLPTIRVHQGEARDAVLRLVRRRTA